MYGWRDLAHYVVDEVHAAIVSLQGVVERQLDRETSQLRRFSDLLDAHNELVRHARDLERRIARLEAP